MSVHAHCTEGVTKPEGREGANGFGIGIGVGVENGDGIGIGGGNRAGTGTGVEAIERTQDGDENGSGDGAGSGNGGETRGRTQDGNGGRSGDGREAKKRKTPYKSCRRDVGNGGDLGVKYKKRDQESIGSVAADPDNLESSKEAGRKTQDTQGLSKNYIISRESVSPLVRLIKGFRRKYH